MARSRVLGIFGVMALSAVACAAPTDEEAGESDAAVSLDTYWADAKALRLDDLTRLSVGFATDSLNDQLTGGNVGARFEAPSVFAAKAQPNSVLPDNSEIKALDTIVSGLAAQFGESELGTQVNKVRLDTLSRGQAKYFVESGFALRGGLNHGWSQAAEGFMEGAAASLGFDANAELSSRVIVAAKDDNLPGLLSAPLSAVKQMRGFVYPRSLQDIKSMKPGEMFALRGQGKLGANFGLGAPLLVAEPTGGLAYRIMVSAGVSGVIGGQLDVQLVRMAGDEVVVDVGVQDGRGVSFSAAIRDGWGVKGICSDGLACLRPVTLAGKSVDLSKLVEKAIEKRLNQYLTFKIEGGAGQSSTRMSLSRFRFHLDKGNQDETQKALEKLLKFDMRLAQALAMKDLDQAEPPVAAEMDAMRAATTSTRNFGFEVLGMNIYHRAVVKKEGTFVVQTPEGARSILFDQVHKDGGWFQMDHAFTRTGVAAQTLDAKNPDKFKSEANLFLQVAVGDKHMDDDIISDNIDAMLIGMAGKEVVDTLDKYGNQLERKVWEACPVQKDQDKNTQSWDEKCNVDLLDTPFMKDTKAQGLQAIEPLIARLPDDYKKLVREAANTRLTLQSVGIHNLDAANGPNTSFTLDVRFDDKALGLMTAQGSKDKYRAALREYLTAVHATRTEVGASKTKDQVRAEVDEKWGGQMDRMAARFEERARAYRELAATEAAVPAKLRGKGFISYPIGLRFQINSDDRKTLESAVVNSTSHERAMAAAQLFDTLKDEADRINAPLYDEHTAAFPLLAMVPRENLEVGMQILADVKSSFWMRRERYQKAGFKSVSASATGGQVAKISAGMFDLGAVINAQ